ncbi:MAG TPA: MFS transporter, partial [Methylomirabilota bacterium]|nr:MFS transporter [Methylomirabilota bacterium]
MSAAPTESKELPSLWRPLRLPVFRNLLAADVVSDVGTFMQNVGAAWLMVSLNAGPFYVALTQTASSLPFFIFALPAGSVGDIVDRRKLILFTEVWMTAIAVLLALFTFGGIMTPLLLLLLTFALSAGDAFETPTWRAVLPELVPKEDLASASALNGIEFNFARAIGPALAGFLIAAAGVGAAFSVNALSFMGVILVIALWKRPATRRSTPAETVTGATAAGLRYVRYSPALRRLMIRSGLAMFFSSGCLALLPSVANEVSRSSLVYGILLGVFGVGAVLGALVMQRMRAVLSLEALISGSLLLFGLCTIAVGMFRNLAVLNAVMLIGGAARLVFLSLFNVILLTRAPDWVRARVL